ncbi:MAG: rRNA maturation RNase YbeY [Flavobacteriales bacterium]
MQNITFNFEDLSPFLKNRGNLCLWLNATAKNEKQKIGAVNYIFCSDKHLLSINKQYLNHNYFTDVITFQYDDNEGVSGDIFISYDRIKENAKEFNQSTNNELHRVMVHGLLHLLGYKDKNTEQQKVMKSKEDFYLSLRAF